MKKYILFDHDGVLVDTEYWYYTANKRVLTEMGIELMMEQYLEIMIQGRSCLDLIATKGADKEKVTQARERRNQYYQNYLKKENIEIPGVEKVLKELSLNYKMAIITTAKKQDFALIHKDRNIVSYMDFVLVREDYEKSKPHPEPYLKGVKQFGCKKEEVLIVEDSERGLNSAVAAGIECAIVYNEFTKAHDFSKATYKINSLSELESLLKA